MKITNVHSTIGAFAILCASVLFGFDAVAQAYPTGPVKLIVPTGAGGAVDVIARIVADHLRQSWNQQVLVVNHPGAGGAIGVRAAGTSPADGSTLYFAISSNFVALPELQSAMPFDVARDFVPIGLVGESPMIIGARPSLGVNSLPEMFALAKRRPGEINLAVLTRGGLPHLTGEWLRSASGADLTLIHYPGAPQALTDLMGGRVHLAIESLPAFSGAISGGSLKALAVASARRLPDMPDLPTVAATIPGFVAVGWMALMAPPGTPEPIAHKVSKDLRTVLARSELKARFAELGTYVRPMAPAELTEFIRDQQRMWKPVIAELGLNTSR
jgi:tripartite-type tricarboxylate transporter receptor subunit TctC